MTLKLALWLLWAGFIAYILLLAPPLHLGETLKLLKNIFTLQWAAINPIILSLFSLVGIWLLIYSSLLFIDGRMQSIPFWPFAIAHRKIPIKLIIVKKTVFLDTFFGKTIERF